VRQLGCKSCHEVLVQRSRRCTRRVPSSSLRLLWLEPTPSFFDQGVRLESERLLQACEEEAREMVSIRANATNKPWAEEIITAWGDSLEALENAAIGTADNQWRFRSSTVGSWSTRLAAWPGRRWGRERPRDSFSPLF
jgi:hypothetical protein